MKEENRGFAAGDAEISGFSRTCGLFFLSYQPEGR
jgi:hypothetical protein